MAIESVPVAGRSIGVDTCSGIEIQIVKLAIGADGVCTLVTDALLVKDLPATTPVVNGVNWTNAAVNFASANAARVGLKIFNKGTTNLFIKFALLAAGVSNVSFTHMIAPGGLYELYPREYSGQVIGAWEGASGSGFAMVTETT